METEQKPIDSSATEPKTDGGRMDRIADQTRGLVDDIKEWIDLKVQLVQIELEERFETLANQILATLVVIVLAFITLLFALIAGSLAIGNWLGDPLWGFLVVTGVLAVITAVVHISKPRFVRAPWVKEPDTESKKLPAATIPDLPKLPESSNSSKGTES